MAGGPRKSKEPKPVSEGKENEDVDVGRVADSPLQDESELIIPRYRHITAHFYCCAYCSSGPTTQAGGEKNLRHRNN